MSLGNMTYATANTPYYFSPAKINGNLYISGDSIALSPAMFAFLHAKEKKGIHTEDIRVVSIGSINEESSKISE